MKMNIDISNIYKKRNAESRSITAENFRGEKGKGGMATVEESLCPSIAECAKDIGVGWKISPCLSMEAGETAVIMNNEGPGVIRHIWMTVNCEFHRDIVIRMYWDGEKEPSVESPLGDLFCSSWGESQSIEAIPINVNSKGGMNCYIPMPFKKHAKITIENQSKKTIRSFFYTINYTLEDIEQDSLYFHAQWRRSNPLEYKKPHVMVDGVKGQGQYIGTFMSWQQNTNGWWGEGEIKMFLDADKDFPTICGTGTEDYFGGAWCYGDGEYSAPYLGYREVSGKRSTPGARYTLYRFHMLDPVFFKSDLRVEMQAIGFRNCGTRMMPLQDDISSVVYWYQTHPHAPFPELPNRDFREIN